MTADLFLNDKAQKALAALELQKKWLPNGIYETARAELHAGHPEAIERWLQPAHTYESLRTTNAKALSKKIAAEAAEEAHQEALQSGTIGYMTRAMIMATLPHARPKSLEFKRTSGDFTLLMHMPNELSKQIGVELPYGPIPRLIFLWMTTEAKLTRSRELHLGGTRSEFMRKLMLTPRTGKRGNMRTLELQLKALLATTFSAWRTTGGERQGTLRLHHRQIASDAELWWDYDSARELEALINVDAEFFKEMLQGGIPVDLPTVNQFKENSLALDIYVWLTYRFSALRRPVVVPWEHLYEQFGSEYQSTSGTRAFKAYFRKQLKRVLAAYTQANVSDDRAGLRLHPSPTHVPALRQ